jgi:hypothetical protein
MEAALHPGADVVGRLDDQRRPVELTRVDAGKPDVPARVADGASELTADPVPDSG